MLNFTAIDCPSCNRKVITRRDMLYAAVDGTAQCPKCGRPARLDLLSRWMLSCVIALVLPVLLLYGDVFYSGHLFVVSMVFILGAWRILSLVAFPVLRLEAALDSLSLDRRQSILLLVVLLVVAIVFDSFMASRFESANAPEHGRGAAYRLLNTSGFTKFCAS